MEVSVTGMAPVEGTSATAGHRDLEIDLERDGEGFDVVHMFDVNGEETHDPIKAVEIDDGMELVRLRVGDVLRVRVVINT